MRVAGLPCAAPDRPSSSRRSSSSSLPSPPIIGSTANAASPEGPEGIAADRGEGVSPTTGSWCRRCFHVALHLRLSTSIRRCEDLLMVGASRRREARSSPRTAPVAPHIVARGLAAPHVVGRSCVGASRRCEDLFMVGVSRRREARSSPRTAPVAPRIVARGLVSQLV